MRTILDVIDRYREAFSVLHHEVRYLARRPRYRQALTKIVDQYLSAVAEVLERGRERLELRRGARRERQPVARPAEEQDERPRR